MFLIVFAILAMTISACAVSADAVQPPATEPPDTEPATTPESTGDLSTTPAAVSHGNEVGGYVELVDALRAASATVEPAGEVEQVFFSAKGQKIQINGIEVQVFEYSDEAARKAESDQISPDGTNIGTSMITWVDQPNFERTKFAQPKVVSSCFILGKILPSSACSTQSWEIPSLSNHRIKCR